MTSLSSTSSDNHSQHFLHSLHIWITKRTRADYLLYGLMVTIAIIVFGLQAPNIGFYGPNHGWTSSHGLAIMRHATPDNYLVGYALQFRGDDGSIGYTYFDRYPLFFSTLMNGLLSLSSDLPTQVKIARAVMNGVFLLTLWAAWLVVRRLINQRFLAVAVVLLAFSGYKMIFYKDMIHYDQPALLGSFLLIYGIIRYKADGVRWPVYVMGIIAISLGRGYASYTIMGLWMLWEWVAIWRTPDKPFSQRLRALIGHDATPLFAIAILWGSMFLSYNLFIESQQRGIPITQTSIIDSALRRLPFGGEKDLGRTIGKDVPDWGTFAWLQFVRLSQWVIPVKMDNPSWYALLPGLAMWFTVPLYVWRQSHPWRLITFLTAFWGAFWLTFMINLAHGHEYAMMYAVGLPLIFYITLVANLRKVPGITALLLLLSVGMFTWVNFQVRAEVSNPQTNRARYTEDYNRILQRIDGNGHNIYINISDGECVIENDFCYVLGFYLAPHYLSSFSMADYVITRLPYYHAEPVFLPPDDTNGLLLMSHSLTPENATAFLFDTASAERRYIPEDARTLFRFGENLTLQHWLLKDSITVQPCQQVGFESWWLTENALDANYSMLLAMVNTNGDAVSESNSDLTFLATRVWQPGMFHLDARTLTVPCDIAPGEYPLVLSVYEPGAEKSLDVFTAEGNPNGDFMYVTTLFVEAR